MGPHSSEPDFSDAGYLGLVIWKDYDDALAMYPDAKEALDSTMDTSPSQTYDDKPKFSLWADKKRKRVRICQIWIRRVELKKFDANGEVPFKSIVRASPNLKVKQQIRRIEKSRTPRAHRPRSNFGSAPPPQRSRKLKARLRSIWRERGTSAYPINLIRKTINCRRSCRTCRR